MRLSTLDIYLGKFFFRTLLPFSFNLYNFFFKKFIAKPINQNLLKFEKFGYFSIKNMNKERLLPIQNEIKKQTKDIKKINYNHFFEINSIIRKQIINYLQEDQAELFNDLKKYYNGNIFLSKAKLHRIFYSDIVDKEVFANYFHYDQVIMTSFKIFININDVSKDTGPFTFYDLENSKKFVKYFNYKRKRYDLNQEKYFPYSPYKHIGDAGSSIICRSGECLHRASVPEKNKYRDLLCLVFVCSPDIKSNDPLYFYNNVKYNIWNGADGKITEEYASNIRGKKLLKNFLNHLSN